MHEVVNEKVSVLTRYDRERGVVEPVRVKWQGRVRNITKTGYYHKVRVGRTIQHVFHVSDGSLDYRLRCDSETLMWHLEEVADGLAS